MKKTAVSLLVMFLFSCGVAKIKAPEQKDLYEVLTQQEYGGASTRFFEILTEPDEIRMLQGDSELKNKINTEDIHNANFIVLNMGEKNTGGYSIGVESVVETDKNLIITVKETNPKPDSRVTMALTNPYCVVKLNSKKEIIIK
ncbi:protease complex subunit PrcB family protein [Flavobacterium sp. K5-23]|uniref:protease complex subunit PrcB family protein n=1 Tax=Flavobacterium sp. K5-23 TaxID=2746225 RepID=UPI00200E46E2|nr:protease complex subunit PrcB family protein [Flavobacterium sp. K5-23]UQD57255.1 protease complex subunit PrcB family protein [Flavobacterium sp. K5-23]